jgi:acyl-CoA thioesterase FadM
MRDEYTAITRFADLDTQRHITSRTYESFALEGRYRLLEKLGIPFERIKNEQISLVTINGYCKFHRQQFPGAALKVETAAHLLPAAADGQQCLHWDQKILDASGELVAHLQQSTRAEKGGVPFTIEGLAGEAGEPVGQVLYEDLKPWSGRNQRVVSQYQIPYADRDFAGKYNAAALWKIFEEGRWMFVERSA